MQREATDQAKVLLFHNIIEAVTSDISLSIKVIMIIMKTYFENFLILQFQFQQLKNSAYQFKTNKNN